MKSIMQNNKSCYICGFNGYTEEHHIYFGSSNRKISEQNGFKVHLCYEHHRGDLGVHGKYGNSLNIRLKQECERKYIYQLGHTKEEFIKLIGKNYLDN